MYKETIIPSKGSKWKHTILNKIAKSREFPMRLRIFHMLKSWLNIDFLRSKSASGVSLLLDISDWVQYQIYFYGLYEDQSLKLFKSLAQDAEYILDVGAHVGQYALEAAHDDISKSKQIFAIEANPKTFTYLLNNIQLNDFSQVKAVLGAISNQNQIVSINIPSYGNLGNTQILRTGANKDINYYIATYAIGLLLESQKIPRIDLMKIDIEGHEYPFFQSMFEEKIFPKKIIFEYIPTVFQDINLCVELLKVNGYSIFTIDNEPFIGQPNVPEQNLFAAHG